jgi:hypothetical protein
MSISIENAEMVYQMSIQCESYSVEKGHIPWKVEHTAMAKSGTHIRIIPESFQETFDAILKMVGSSGKEILPDPSHASTGCRLGMMLAGGGRSGSRRRMRRRAKTP